MNMLVVFILILFMIFFIFFIHFRDGLFESIRLIPITSTPQGELWLWVLVRYTSTKGLTSCSGP